MLVLLTVPGAPPSEAATVVDVLDRDVLDGGDLAVGGYHYRRLDRVSRHGDRLLPVYRRRGASHVPTPLERVTGAALLAVEQATWHKAALDPDVNRDEAQRYWVAVGMARAVAALTGRSWEDELTELQEVVRQGTLHALPAS